MKGLVYKSTGSWYTVKSETGDRFDCKIKGKLRLENINSTNPVVVGDFVEFDIEDHDQQEVGIIKKIFDRRNYILRKSVNLSKQTHILASNIDLLLLVITLKNPITTTSFIDRFLVSAEAYSIKTLLVFNKCDLYNEVDKDSLNYLINIYDSIGYETIKTCANSGKGIKELEKKISNKTIMLGGHSGVGKTSIINAIDGALNLKVGNISDQHSQGKHTTTYAELHDLDNNIKLIDTPGIKGFGLVNYNIDEISNFFPEFFNVKSKCKFNNCIHLNEPKCRVKDKVKSGEISKSRYDSYIQIINDDNLKHR
ncbi:MAG: ribosome small subunit-dependent GTPase A [Flavobacteriaceae bacterium]|nr:ribosome small subunit-dependent GTPase A [Flavobacteriaceae bacterium]